MKNQFNNTASLFVLNVVAVAVAGTLLTACSRSQSKTAESKPMPVVVTHAKQITVTNLDEYPGHVEAVESVEIRPRISGYIESIHFTDGAEVKKGDLLFIIDPKAYQADLDRARADRQSAETKLELAQNDLKRAEALKESKAVSAEELDTRSKTARSAEAALASAKAAEALAEVNLGYTKITAPISGRIGSRLLTVGNLVQPSGAALATIVTVSPIYCYFDANESAFLGYRKTATNAEGALEMPCQLVLGGDQTITASGLVNFYDNQVNPKTGTVRMRAVFANENRALMPGLFANIRVPAGAPESVVVVPDALISSSQGRKYVLTVSSTNTVAIRPVVTGRLHGTARVVQGIGVEDNIIDSGQMQIIARPGMPVQIMTAAPQAANAQH
jgi:RND family efflux transporter MFP subunit